MKQSRAAILARCNGDLNAAIDYCEQIAHIYSNLREEYRGHREFFLNQSQREAGIKFAAVAQA
jgi:hypothetical protein